MRLGALILQMEPWSAARQGWQHVESLGFDVGYVADHLTHAMLRDRWWADGWTTLAAAAQVTSALELGPLVASAALTSPAVLARRAATLQDLSGGRFVLGLGAGVGRDLYADGRPEMTAAEKMARFGDVVAGVRAVWSGEESWSGQQLSVHDQVALPLPPGRPSPHLMLAAHGPRGFDLVAEYADGWSTYGGPRAAELAGAELWQVLSDQGRGVIAACERRGRDPAELRHSVLLGFGPDRPLESVQAFQDTLGVAAEHGFDELVVYWPIGSPGSRFWADPEVLASALAAARTRS